MELAKPSTSSPEEFLHTLATDPTRDALFQTIHGQSLLYYLFRIWVLTAEDLGIPLLPYLPKDSRKEAFRQWVGC
ncbi:hypothetical protein BT93_L2875 [Corymbia citriodora subsp. variegata]|uniref:Uncharacterized protein n=1 Tax=Corymbia citriodora subsp. variegata TaxID=360336 RepID=A0A8T0CNW2_CORYI|nr:hypothetical protein BT93_L2875 [Corymbia citriodora subsp. variegata]